MGRPGYRGGREDALRARSHRFEPRLLGKRNEIGRGRSRAKQGSRLTYVLVRCRSRYGSVAHLWGAFCIRERRFQPDSETGYEGWHDFQFFLAESHVLFGWVQSWQSDQANSEPPDPEEAWRLPDDWMPPERQPGWPRTGGIPGLEVSEDLLAGLQRPGRPRSSG